jgi:hypothetical protein
MRIARVVSGGQTGADRAALDVAVATGVPYGGWCPRGGWAEDLTVPPGLRGRYPRLQETPSADTATRTRWNVRDSDATLVLVLPGAPCPDGSPGTRLALSAAAELRRPHLVTAAEGPVERLVDRIVGWLEPLGAELRLNVAGPRESESPGLYCAAYAVLQELLGRG